MKANTKKFLAVLLVLALPAGASAQFDLFGSKAEPSPPGKQIAYFKVKGRVVEAPAPVSPLFGQKKPVTMKSLLSRLKAARMDPNVVSVIVDFEQATLGFGQIEELHAALSKFAAVDKDVYIHADTLTTPSYAVATGTAHISVVPTGDLWLLGLYGEIPYIRGTLDKLGVTPDFEQFEDYKSAAESFMRTGPSKPSQEMSKWLLDGIYDGLVKLIAKGRNISSEKVMAIIDNGPYSAEEALEKGLVDSVMHKQDFINKVKSRFGHKAEIVKNYGDDDDMDLPQDFGSMVSFFVELMNPSRTKHSEPSVAIVYVEGSIVTGEAEMSPFGGGSGAHSTTIRRALDKAAKDSTVRAVVLRVDSPGGSALASEIILDATKRVAKRKPLIVSMGNVAGSGGYYVACGSKMIFADSNTITASIGVIGGKLVTTDAWQKIGVNWHSQQRGASAGLFSSATKFSDGEREKLRHYMGTVYEIFKDHVVKARGKKLTKPIEKIAGGRVFTGAQAIELGLVDKIGGLDDAIKFAAKEAGVVDYDIRVIPDPPSLIDMLTGKDQDDESVRISLQRNFSLGDVPLISAALQSVSAIDPIRAQAFLRTLQRVEMLHREGVLVMMPHEMVIR